MNCLNSDGLISQTLNRVTSGELIASRASSLRLTVTIAGLFLVPHPKERGLEDIDVSMRNQLLEVAQEIGEQQVTNVHSVNVGISRNHDFVVTQPIHTIFDAKGAHDVVEFLILIDCIALEAITVQWLPFQGKDRLV